MIILPSEIAEVEKHLESVYESDELDDIGVPSPETPVFFANRPHLLMPLGFDEFRAVEQEASEDARVPKIPLASFDFEYEAFFRSRESGSWHWFEGITHYAKDASGKKISSDYHVHFVDPLDVHRFESVSKWIAKLKAIASAPDPHAHFIIPPGIWTPRMQVDQQISLARTVPSILQTIAAQEKTLSEIPWRELEEIVAELLRASGLQVFVTPRSRDGGRDVVARGELIPGEPTLLAVEVKQKPIVGIHDVQRALRANEDFPALMIATAGRFSGGVIQERQRHRNQMRLFLKDGVALKHWIDAYAKKLKHSV